MANQDLIDAVGRYIDRYYEPVNDEIKRWNPFFLALRICVRNGQNNGRKEQKHRAVK